MVFKQPEKKFPAISRTQSNHAFIIYSTPIPPHHHLQLAPDPFLLSAGADIPARNLVFAILDVRLKPLDELLDGDLPIRHGNALALWPAWREKHGPEHMHDAVSRDGVLDGDALVPVNADPDEAVPPRDVDRQALIIKQRREVDVEMSVLAAAGPITLLVLIAGGRREDVLLLALHPVVRVRVQRLVRDDVVLEQRAQEPEALLRVEEEGVGGGAEAREGRVRGGEEGEARAVQVVLVRLVVVRDQARLLGRELERRESAGEEGDETAGRGWGDEDAVDAVGDAVFGELGVGVCC